MSVVNRLAKNIFSNWAVLITNIVISFFLAPYIVYKLGNVYYGIWSIVMQFTGYLYIMDFGVRESVVRYTSRLNAKGARKTLNSILSTALIMYSAVAVLCVAIAAGAAWVFPAIFDTPSTLSTEIRFVVLMVGLTIAQTFIFNVFHGVIMGLQRYDIGNVVNLGMAFLKAGLIVAFLESGYRIIALASVHLITGILTGILMFILANRLLVKMNSPFKFGVGSVNRFRALGRKLFNYSGLVFIINISQKVIFSTDAIIVGVFMPVANVTFYAIAGNLIEYLRHLITAAASVLNPLISQLNALGEDEKVRDVLIHGARLSLFVGLPVATVYIILGHTFIGLWMGPEYVEQAGAVLVILAITQALSLPHHTMCMVLYGLSKHKVLAYWKVAEAFANITLSIILVQRYGLIGVALGTAITHTLIALVILPRLVCKEIGLPVGAYWLRVYLRPTIVLVPYAITAFWVYDKFRFESLLEFFTAVCMLCVLYVIVSYFVVLLPHEKERLSAMLLRRFKKTSAEGA